MRQSKEDPDTRWGEWSFGSPRGACTHYTRLSFTIWMQWTFRLVESIGSPIINLLIMRKTQLGVGGRRWRQTFPTKWAGTNQEVLCKGCVFPCNMLSVTKNTELWQGPFFLFYTGFLSYIKLWHYCRDALGKHLRVPYGISTRSQSHPGAPTFLACRSEFLQSFLKDRDVRSDDKNQAGLIFFLLLIKKMFLDGALLWLCVSRH